MSFLFNPFTSNFDEITDVSANAVGSSPNANALTITQVGASAALTLQPADGTHPGVVTTATQVFSGIKNFTSDVYVGTFPLTTGDPFVRMSVSGAPGPASGIQFYDGNGGNELFWLYGDGGIGLSIYDVARGSGLAHFYGTQTQFMNTTTTLPYFTVSSSALTIPALSTAGLTRVTSAGLFSSAEISGDATTSGSNALTLATVNSNVGTFTNATVTVNAKGLVTAASSGTAPVTSVSVASANGFAGSSSGGSSPALTLSTTTTAGSVLFSDGTALQQDNANFFWSSSNHRLGIGNNNPQFPLDVQFASNSQAIQITNTNATQSSGGGGILALSANSGAAMTANNRLGFLNFQGSDGTNQVKGAGIQVFAQGTWSSSSTPASMAFYTSNSSSHNSLTLALTLDQNQGATFTGSVSAPSLTLTTTPLAVTSGGTGTTTSTGSGSVVLATSPTMSSPIVGTQAQSDNSTKAASTAFVTTAVNNAIAGVNPAVAVQAATTAAADTSGYTYNNGVSGVGATLTGTANTALTVDGYTFTAINQRLLVKNDTQSPSGAFNGIYYVTQIQTSLLPVILTRALDFDTPSDINNTGAIPVVNGTVNGTTSWVVTSTVNTVGTDPVTFTKFSVNPSTILTNPMTMLGDIIYENATPAPARLAGNTTSTKNFLTQTGTGSASAAPTWGTISTTDLPIGAVQSDNASTQRVEWYLLSNSGGGYTMTATSDTGATSARSGTGKATITFGTAFSTAPGGVASVNYQAGVSVFTAVVDTATGSPSSTTFHVAALSSSNVYADCDGFYVIVMGKK